MNQKKWEKILKILFNVKSNKKCGWNDGINIPCKTQCIDCKLKYGKDE